MEGFFNAKETASDTRPDGKTYSCVSCGRLKDCDSPKMKYSGKGKKGILNIFASPTSLEDKNEKPFSSKPARLLKSTLKDFEIDLENDCYNTYAAKCYSGDKPTPYQLDCCRKYLVKLIKELKPKVILIYGDTPLYSLIGNRWKKGLGTITKWRGWKIPDQDFKAFITPVFSPEFILDAKTDVEDLIWRQDISAAIELIKKPFPVYKEPEIIYLKKDLSVLDKIKFGDVAFDYETTGLKPHDEGHKIICASVAVSSDKVYVFPLPKKKKNQKPFLDLLQNKKVGKIAQNMKYEDNWTNEILKIPVNNWLWDTMLATHLIDNREGITSLKFQTYVQFGIVDYDSEINYYLKADGDAKSANRINRIEQLKDIDGGMKKLLKYCALDAIFEYRLAEYQRKFIPGTQGLTEVSPIQSNFPKAYNLLHDGILALAKAERQGLRIDTDYAEKKKKGISRTIKKLEDKLYDSKFYKHWAHTIKSGKPNLNSGPQLANFIYGTKKIEPLKFTETGKGSTDEEALSLLKIPELDMVLQRNKLRKLRDTYLDAFMREQVDGVLHPAFNLHTVQTYRSSSSDPNFQNIPKRDETAMKTVRKAIYARKGFQLMELDYSGIEVAIAACYHKDKNMIKYITDPNTDMHGDMAEQIFKIDNWDRHRKDHSILRAAAKNGFVFPQFYGDYFKMNAVNICSNWVSLPQTKWKKGEGFQFKDSSFISDHLISKGIKSFDDFVEHIRVIEKDFWGKRFPVYNQWKLNHYDRYQKQGYVSLKTGFVCKGVMSRNASINYPVQGAAFHCLLWLLIKLTEELERLNYKTKIVGQIHDAVVLDVHPEELHEVYSIVQKIGTKDILKAFPWINVPLSIDAELCPVDGSWAEKKEWNPSDDLPF